MAIIRKVLFAAAFLAAASASASAEPTLWRVEGGEGTLYVFGTIHRLPDEAEWLSPRLIQIIKEANAVILEVANSQAAQDYMALIAAQPGVARSTKPLDAVLPGATFARLTHAAAALGIDGEALLGLRPWYAAFLISQVAGEEAGYFTRFGADSVIERLAKENGIACIGLETPVGQVMILASLPVEAEIAFLRATLDEMEDGESTLPMEAAAWEDGDLALIEKFSLPPLLAHPALYETLIEARNRAWLPVIESYLGQEGTYLLTVGAGHLVGPDSVLSLLEEKGYRVIRE